MDDVVNHLGREAATVMRAAAQLGQYLAYMQRERLNRLEQHSRLQAQRMREVMDTERRLASPTYTQLLRDAFWEKASLTEIAHAYGLSRRFSHLDPMAVIAAREAQRRAEEKWGINLNDMHTSTEDLSQIPTEALPTVGKETPEQVRSEIARLDAQTQHQQEQAALRRVVDMQAAQAEAASHAAWDEAWDRVVAANPNASRLEHMLLTQEAVKDADSKTAWDTRQARAEHVKESIEAGTSLQAVRAALIVDTSQSTPATKALAPKHAKSSAPTHAVKPSLTLPKRPTL